MLKTSISPLFFVLITGEFFLSLILSFSFLSYLSASFPLILNKDIGESQMMFHSFHCSVEIFLPFENFFFYILW